MKIEDICTRICSGGTPKSGKAEYYENGTIPWLNTKEINFNRIQATEAFITEEGLNNSSAKWIKPHTVIVAMYGATAGRVAVAEIPLTTNQACCNLEVDETIADYRYIYYWLKQNFDNIAGLANGGAQQNLSAKVIRQIEINLPDLIKQRSIANFLDSFDSKIEANAKLNGYLAAQWSAEGVSHPTGWHPSIYNWDQNFFGGLLPALCGAPAHLTTETLHFWCFLASSILPARKPFLTSSLVIEFKFLIGSVFNKFVEIALK